MALFRCGGGLPIDLTDSTNGYGIDVPQNGTVTVPITKTPRYVWWSMTPSSNNNYLYSYFYDVKNVRYYRMTKTSSATAVSFNTSATQPSELTINSNNVVITNTTSSARSIGVVVIY